MRHFQAVETNISKRQGLEWANYWNPADWQLVDADLSLSSSRYRGSDPAGS